MKLEIKLKDPKYCNGCPCRMELKDGLLVCRYYYGEIEPLGNANEGWTIRPQKCIKENGL